MIHASAIVDPSATIADDAEISAYAVIGSDVTIGSGTWIGPHTVVQGPARIGRENRIYQFCSIGEAPQDKKYHNEDTGLVIGDRNVVREFCTFNRGTVQDRGETVLGNDNWIMAYVHLAHDCVVGNHAVFANGATLAGHVTIDDYVILGGFTLVHQFCRIGKYAFTGMGTAISKDVPPYVMAFGAPGEPRGINREGLKRHNFSADSISRIKEGYRLLYRSELSFQQAQEKISGEYGEHPEIQEFLTFCASSERGVLR